ncbi:T9SS type B sorting domain-containing protein [Chryseobacterium polytrichastri]|uniref:Gliding motility-associated C-terminal domain-containing protein n=1 Tax=Chryseobacterium polytrichastri TaxID=1302687 RepID=A0A1M6X3B9_9FLAO|nr:T9SS type B sorting domain-containing protein [Chryseobacterium polytrichastri]SHL00349.1 gliding motility-associated C-terminal domain-containing protein [Chryseobacterium polytrichastri]
MKKYLLLLILLFSQLYFSQSDCITAIPVCGNSDISYDPTGPGNVADIPNPAPNDLCLKTGEHYSVWYTFTIATSGTLTFEVTPNTNPLLPQSDINNQADYDWAVWGPSPTCGNLGTPVTCNYAGKTGAWPYPTGLSANPPNAPNTGYNPPMNVLAGETYVLLVDNYSHNALGFSLTWGGTATLASAFNDPVLTPHPFVTPGVPGPTPTSPNEILKCALPSLFDFSTLSPGILNGNPNFSVTYHLTNNDAITGNAPITTPIMVNATDIYYYRIKYTDPANPANPINQCFQTGKFKFKQGNIIPKNATLFACNNNNIGTGLFDLTAADVYTGGNITKKYYPTLNDLNAGTNEITNPTNYTSIEKKVYVKITTTDNCTANAEITLKFYALVIVKEASLESCYIPTDITTAVFDLTSANVSALPTPPKKFYATLANATSGTNEIGNPAIYITTTGTAYVRVYSADNCYSIAKINLKVLPPVKSNVLKDKTICLENKTTLDAGAGFDGYEWSTGATTQTISNVGVGAYWVKLKTGKCFTLQNVNVYATQQPVVSSIDITNNTITINVNGGTPPYKYSLDGITWQDSNVFTDLPRGEVKVYVKDTYNCNPIDVQVTVPNLINAITPNGDNINDYIDYSALAYKKNLEFIVYDRYGNKLFTADKTKAYRWDGTSGGKKILTGTYWYTITWNENDKNNTQTKYNGWVLVKNRE